MCAILINYEMLSHHYNRNNRGGVNDPHYSNNHNISNNPNNSNSNNYADVYKDTVR